MNGTRLAILVITILAFARLTSCDFTYWDDQETIHQNPRLNPPTWNTLSFYWTTASDSQTMGLYVPVTYTTWAALAKLAWHPIPDAQGMKLNPAMFHTANVLLHAATALVVFQLLSRLFKNKFAAAVGALLFALHPVQVEPVGWISGTKDLLCGWFAISASLMYVRSVQIWDGDPTARNRWPSRWRYLSGLLLFILAMLSKPTAVVTPLIAGVIAVLLLNRSPKRTALSLLPWFLLMIPCIIWTKIIQPPSWESPLPAWAKPAVAADAMAFYLFKLVWPAQLCIDYSRTPASIAASGAIFFTWIVPAGLTGWLIWKRKSCPAVVAAALLFVIPLLPVLGFVPFEFQYISTTADHYLYLPMLGVAVLATSSLTRLSSRPATFIWIAVLLLLALRSIAQEPTWQNTRCLYDHALEVNPRSAASYAGLGFITTLDARRLQAEGQPEAAQPVYESAIRLYRKALECDPIAVPAMVNVALDYQQVGRLDLARGQINHVIDSQPRLPPGLRADPISIANYLIQFQDYDGAIAWLDQVIRQQPENVQAMILRQRLVSAEPHR